MMQYLLLILLLLSPLAHAHKASDSYLNLREAGRDWQGQWDIALRDLDYAIGLDSNADGSITWGELRSRHNEIAAYALAHLHIRADDKLCYTQVTRQQVDQHSDGSYAVLEFTAHCPAAAQNLEIDYSLFFDLDPQHRGLLRVDAANISHSAILAPAQASQRFTLNTVNLQQQFFDYASIGVWHIWSGFDHMLFLIVLLLPAVLTRYHRHWHGVLKKRDAIIDTLKIVTAFTLAHSITLSLAVFEVVQLPSRWVEAMIAASVIVAALNNIYPQLQDRRWLVAFSFGLLHGFGFANVLIDLGLAPGALALSLAAFNLGVEAGQLVIVAAFLPLALLARNTTLYSRGVLQAGSWLAALIATIWLVQRVGDFQLIPG